MSRHKQHTIYNLMIATQQPEINYYFKVYTYPAQDNVLILYRIFIGGTLVQGWIKLHRKVLDSAVGSSAEFLGLWAYMLLKATHKPRRVFHGQKEVELRPGQFITGRHQLSEATGLSGGKLERMLNVLQKLGQIDQETNSRFRVISIRKWSSYQGGDQPAISERSASDHKQECKNERRIYITKSQNTISDLEIPDELKSDEVTEALESWAEYKQDRNELYKSLTTWKSMLTEAKKVASGNPELFAYAIHYAIKNNWIGVNFHPVVMNNYRALKAGYRENKVDDSIFDGLEGGDHA